MKVCPTCNKVYKHDEISFCLRDGTTLLKKMSGEQKRSSSTGFLSLIRYAIDSWSARRRGVARDVIVAQREAAVRRQKKAAIKRTMEAIDRRADEVRGERLEEIRKESEREQRVEQQRKIEEYLGFRTKVIHLKNLVLEKAENAASGGLAYVEIDSMDGLAFEHFVANLMSNRGFSVEVTKGSGDLGVDIKATNHQGRFAVQVKRYNQPVSRRAVSDAVAGRDHYGFDFAMVVTNNYFTPDAKKLAESNSCVLIERSDLEEWMGGLATTKADYHDSLKTELTRLRDAGYLWGEDVVAATIKELGAVSSVNALAKAEQEELYTFPSSSLLQSANIPGFASDKELLKQAEQIGLAMNRLDIQGRVVNIEKGDLYTSYEFKPDGTSGHVNLSEVSSGLRTNLGIPALRTCRRRGKEFLCVEMLNKSHVHIAFRDVIESSASPRSRGHGTLALGKVRGKDSYVLDLFSHEKLFIAGATNRKRTAGLDSLICSVFFKASPSDVRLILVDSERSEFSAYDGIPHLATPVVTGLSRASMVVKWLGAELVSRYKVVQSLGVRNLDEFNAEAQIRKASQFEDIHLEPLPHLIFIVDELSELLNNPSAFPSELLNTFRNKSSWLGIHIIFGAQRVDRRVADFINSIPGITKIISHVPAPYDARFLIDESIVKDILSPDEMVVVSPSEREPIFLNEAQLSSDEIKKVVDHVKAQGRPEYDTTITKSEEEMDNGGELPGRKDPLFHDALRSVVQAKRASTSLLQRHLRIGYGRAAAILDAMVREGYIGEMDGSTRARPSSKKPTTTSRT
jgi:DNA segregation ATPase FtsK/SpoIIIE-like protein